MNRQNEIILINEKGDSRYFRLNRPFFFLIKLFTISIFACYALFGIFILGRATTRLFITISRVKEDRLDKSFNSMQAFTKSIEIKMDSLFIYDDERRAINGANTIEGEVREVGVGGPATIEDYEDIFLVNSDIERKNLNDLIEKLLRQSDFQIYSENEFKDFFNKKQYAMDHIPSVQPAEGSFLSGFGMRVHPILHTRRMHKGMDISNSIGTPVLASAEGNARTGVSESFGTYVLLEHGNGYSTIYAHLQSVIITDNEPIHRGQIIGYLGNSGLSTGPHLHYEVHVNRIPVDPNPYLLPEHYIVD